MGVCPVPKRKRKTDYSNPGSFKATPPQGRYEICNGGTTSVITGPGQVVTQTVCCPQPGPPGPTGCALSWVGEWASGTQYYKEGGDPCTTSIVSRNGTTYICTSTHTSAAADEPGVGASWDPKWDIFGESNRMRWVGDWTDSYDYKKNDVVRNSFDGNAYVCSTDHTSSAGDEPGVGSWWAQNWDRMTDSSIQGMPPEAKDFLTSLQDSILDWMDTATVGDWLQALAVGAGIIYAGVKINDMMSSDGTGDGEADSRYTGTPGYNGTYTAPNLQQVVISLMTYAGYTGSEYSVVLLPTTPVEFTVNGSTSIRTILNNLALAYQFDICASGGFIIFVPKYGTSIRTLTPADLGHLKDSDTLTGAAPYVAKRNQGIDLPRSVTMSYYSAALDHNVFTQMSTLDTFLDGQDVKVDVPFTMTDAEAKRITETALVNAHMEQQQYTFTTDYNNIDLDVGDVITIPLDSGGTTNVRIIQILETDDGLLEFTVTRADNASYSYTASPAAPVTPPEQTTNNVSSVGYSQTLFIEVPPLNDAETLPRVMAAIHGYGDANWPGAVLYRSTDGGATYNAVVTSYRTPTIGMVSSAISAPTDYHIWDTTTSISVTLKQGSLANSTDLAVQNGANWCMIGEEVIGFVNATLTGPNTYTLSRLLRGRQGSETKCTGHVSNELFVMLDDQLTVIPIDYADINKTVKYKTVTIGSDISKSTADDVKPFGLNMRPWRVAQPDAVKQVNGDWLITFKERPRYNNSLRDYTEITHDSDWAGFAIAIMDNANVVKRTLTTVNNYWTYTVADQTTDFGSAQTTLKASIIQMSSAVGGGYPHVIDR
jgi:Putative phage tail protein